MNIKLLEEPLLEFGMNESICPKRGISNFHPYDLENVRPEKIAIGVIGKSESIEIVLSWIEKCKKEIKNPKPKLNNLFASFPGFSKDTAFKSQIVYDPNYLRKINNSEIESVIKKSEDLDALVENMVELYVNEIKYLAKNKNPDVILCVLDEKLTSIFLGNANEVLKEETKEEDAVELEDDEEIENYNEYNFRRLLKSRAMAYNIPIQIMRDRIANPTSDMQDLATIAWNFFSAIYYKASGVPWALKKESNSIDCFAGISFYKSRDRKTTQTSVTQIFNEHGKGVILRGGQIDMKKGDLEPHLSENQAFELMDNALKEYYEALKIFPQRLVVHKSSNYSQQEIDGFIKAAHENRINSVDLVTIMPSSLRLYREAGYPPLRGTFASIDDNNFLLYTRGFVNYFETYPGQYIPNPLHIRLFSHDESPEKICKEILGLTKMNWNNTQFDRKFPITIECSRKVGDILKYIDINETPQIKYSFYM